MAKGCVCTVRLLALVVVFPSLEKALGLRRNLKGSPLSLEAGSNDYAMFMPPKEDAPLNIKLNGAHFLRIQKTGGTTFGEHIMRKFCGPESDICKWASHLDWSSAKEGWNGPVVTLLRDPVERTMSEYSFIRSKDGNYSCRQAQWDFRNFTWFNAVASEPDEDVALNLYLHGYQDSPSRNRQALYLNGFKRIVDGTPVPKYTYDWDLDHASTLAQAKDHLDQITVFGITDCFLPSMHVIARELGWAEDDVVAMATNTHSRVAVRSSLLLGQSSTTKRQRWRDTTDPSVVDRIERANQVDMELYRYALRSFSERFGVDCANALSA